MQMDRQTGKEQMSPKAARIQQRQDRLARQLRENLKRRKEQSRKRAQKDL